MLPLIEHPSTTVASIPNKNEFPTHYLLYAARVFEHKHYGRVG